MEFDIKVVIRNIPHPAKLAIIMVLLAKTLVLAIGYAVTYWVIGPAPPLTIIMNMFNHFDAPHYVFIAKNWYVNIGDPANFIAFFPLYPILIRLFTFDVNYINLSALIVSNICSLIAFFYLYKLTKLEFNDGVAAKAVLFLSVFPTAYFLSAPYTEGLFLALVVASIYYARLGKWQFAGLISFFAALTRIAGLLLLPVLLVEYFHQKDWKPTKIDNRVLWPFLALAGFLTYLGINYQVTGNPFTFLTVESTHWGMWLDPWIGLRGAIGWAKILSFPNNITLGFAPLVFAAFGLLMIGVSLWRRLRPVHIVYMLLSYALAVSTSSWMSVPRFIMAMFPMFMLFGLLTNRKSINIAIVIISGGILCFFTVLFVSHHGYWAF